MTNDNKTHDAAESPAEMQIDLGYAAETTSEYDEGNTALDEIHTLSFDEMVVEEPGSADLLTASVTRAEPSAAAAEAIITLSEVVPETAKAGGPKTPTNPATETPTGTVADTPLWAQAKSATPSDPRQTAPANLVMPPFSKPLPEKSDNPFLPQHILDKLNQGRKNLAEDIQTSAALDMSTALLRAQARAERVNKPQQFNNPFSNRDRATRDKQKLVDDLVEEYLPLVAAELRRRLLKLLDE